MAQSHHKLSDLASYGENKGLISRLVEIYKILKGEKNTLDDFKIEGDLYIKADQKVIVDAE